MPRSWRVRVEDILEAIERIERYTSAHTQQSFTADLMAAQAVAFNLMIIGEAAARLPDEVRQANPSLPWGKMRAMRNFIAHAYFEVKPEVLWFTIRQNLPPLVAPLQQLLVASKEDPQR